MQRSNSWLTNVFAAVLRLLQTADAPLLPTHYVNGSVNATSPSATSSDPVGFRVDADDKWVTMMEDGKGSSSVFVPVARHRAGVV